MNFDFMARRRVWFVAALAIILVGLASLLIQGLNFGIDFTGGTRLHLELPGNVSIQEMRDVLSQVEAEDATGRVITLEGSFIQTVDGENEFVIRTVPLTEDEQERLLTAIRENWAGFTNENILDIEGVGPVVGGELIRNALMALSIAALAIIGYISYRFQFKYAITALAALFFDTFVVISAFSILQVELNSPFVATILIIVGYSINDTIVLFDRIRENLKYESSLKVLDQTVNRSINQTLVRSLNTSLTTLLVIGSLLFLGGETIRPFALPLFIGIISGTFSSIFIASPIWYSWRMRETKVRA
ncbi:MAG: protein translocase subunit SecF [Firmicutes bacterium]|nr:protein translocase subunit SecF [Bacillota bacterium]